MKERKIKKVKKYLQSYMKLAGWGFCGRLLSPECKEFRKYKEDHPDYDENIMTWCITMALEALETEQQVENQCIDIHVPRTHCEFPQYKVIKTNCSDCPLKRKGDEK